MKRTIEVDIRTHPDVVAFAAECRAIVEESDRLATENAQLRMRVAQLRGSLIATKANLPRHIAELVERDLNDDLEQGGEGGTDGQ